MPIAYQTDTQYNCIVIIESLEEGARATGRRLYEDIEPIALRDEMTCFPPLMPRSRTELLRMLRAIAARCADPAEKLMPLIQIDTHGRDDRQGLVLCNGDFVPWDVLGAAFRAINIASANRLVVVLAACHGFRALSVLALQDALKKASPFFALIGPDRKVWPDEIESAMRKFYGIVLPTGDLTAATNAINPPFEFYLCSRLLLRATLDYLWKNCRGRSKKERVEKLTTALIEQSGSPRMSVSDARRAVKARINPEAFDFDKYARRFLMSDHPRNMGRFTVTRDDLLREFREAQARAEPNKKYRATSRRR